MWKLLRRLIVSVLVYGVMLYVIHKYSGGWFWVEATQYDVFLTFGILAAVFWLVNNVGKVILKILTVPLKYLTLGLFSLVLNILVIYIFEFLVNNSTMGVVVHLGTIVQVFILSLVVTIIAFLIKKIT
ncbi:MAG TPA: phage holin family protein [Candidatus Absconditabacterales bacterium]|nr:phage holin family protein [Candidatus Absconditabacterales bacterium]